MIFAIGTGIGAVNDRARLQSGRTRNLRKPVRGCSWRLAVWGAAAAAFLFTGADHPVQAQTFTSLYSFQGGGDGFIPYGALAEDPSGNLYGTTAFGGSNSAGTVFKIDTGGNKSTCYNFAGGPNDGAAPAAALLINSAGATLYGTTYGGGSAGRGTVFELVPCNTSDTVLYTFTASGDGQHPYAGVITDASGDLYGTTSSGPFGSSGTVFAINPSTRAFLI